MSLYFEALLFRPSSPYFILKLSIPRRYRDALQSLCREDVILLPSGKGNSVVVLHHASFLQKAQDLLGISTYVRLTSNPCEHIATTLYRRRKQL